MRNIFCIEGCWSNHPKSRLSIRPILELLNTFYGVKYIYRKCLSKEDFLTTLHTFTYKHYVNYPILYIAYHGLTNRICIGNDTITLKEIADVLEGKTTGKIIHFGSCSTLNTSDRNITNFMERTGCSHLSGYKKDVEYNDSNAFELLYLHYLQNHISGIDGKLKRLHPTLTNKLKFTIHSNVR